MSQLSCIQALGTILRTNIPDLVTISDIESQMPTLPSDQGPYAIIQDQKVREKRLSGGFGGSKAVTFELHTHILAWYGSVSDPSTTAFRTLIDRIQAVMRNSHRLNNLADTPNSRVLYFGENLQTAISPWTKDTSGNFLFHVLIVADVLEDVVDTTDY